MTDQKNSNLLISIIIPVYKVEKYLRQCVDSVLSQTWQNLEIVLVDDGSPDKCPEICDEYAKKDKRIKVIHKENGGLSDARNTGLRESSGQYVFFVDSDDYLAGKEAISGLVSIVTAGENIDLVFFDKIYLHENMNNQMVYPPQKNLEQMNRMTKLRSLDFMAKTGNFLTSAYTKIVRRELLIGNHIEFEKGIYSEDYDWSLQLYAAARNFRATNAVFYVYRKRTGSITTTLNEKNFKDIFHIIQKWTKILPELKIPEEEKRIYLGFLCYLYGMLMGLVGKAEKAARQRLKKGMKRYVFLLKYDINYKTHQVCTLYKYTGFELTCRILQFYVKIKYRWGGKAAYRFFHKKPSSLMADNPECT